jgi:hypothetical protein
VVTASILEYEVPAGGIGLQDRHDRNLLYSAVSVRRVGCVRLYMSVSIDMLSKRRY